MLEFWSLIFLIICNGSPTQAKMLIRGEPRERFHLSSGASRKQELPVFQLVPKFSNGIKFSNQVENIILTEIFA